MQEIFLKFVKFFPRLSKNPHSHSRWKMFFYDASVIKLNLNKYYWLIQKYFYNLFKL